MRSPHVIAVTIACAISFCPCHAHADAKNSKARARQLTQWFQIGNLDSLFGAVRAFDLAGPGDSVVARWVRELGGTVPSNWPNAPATLEGREGLARVLERARSMFGRESKLIEEGQYVNQRLAGQSEYFRISRFSGYGAATITMSWAVDRDGASPGGWLMPTPEAAPTDYEKHVPKTRLRLPFDGEWWVLQGGRKPHENDHVFYPPLRFATDFVVVRDGLSFAGDGTKNSDHYAFGLPILAPAAGLVVAAKDSFHENTPLQPPAGYHGPGNFVVIDHGNGEYSVLAHLKQNSVTVAPGDTVTAGQKVGECGNNGQSTEPHLHYQLQISPRPGGPVVPAVFYDYWADGIYVNRGEPHKGQHIRVR